jgi:hypothetical protein
MAHVKDIERSVCKDDAPARAALFGGCPGEFLVVRDDATHVIIAIR